MRRRNGRSPLARNATPVDATSSGPLPRERFSVLWRIACQVRGRGHRRAAVTATALPRVASFLGFPRSPSAASPSLALGSRNALLLSPLSLPTPKFYGCPPTAPPPGQGRGPGLHGCPQAVCGGHGPLPPHRSCRPRETARAVLRPRAAGQPFPKGVSSAVPPSVPLGLSPPPASTAAAKFRRHDGGSRLGRSASLLPSSST